ncbi:MAG: tRNA (adenosine(37)-N6)-threonylcarbamoyltransferase complex dimerization subunit type 1 TsaB, partial [Ruminococcus sp.]|nr:tRNA (adenosine(37)-N6)-threonylcarbamoyltransferase complex dimerization subunit type 1 TsaB [Candidatus Copronaster equi]
CIACCVMDARCNQVYTALFDITDGKIERLTEDMAVSIDEMSETLKKYKKNKIFVGDGTDLCYNKMVGKIENIKPSFDNNKFQNAVGVCYSAFENRDKLIPGAELIPEYLRLPQAQRELNKKLKK